jgi:hypothetical protein
MLGVGGEQHDKLRLSQDNTRHRRSLFCLKKSEYTIWIGGGDRRSEEPSFRRGNIQAEIGSAGGDLKGDLLDSTVKFSFLWLHLRLNG